MFTELHFECRKLLCQETNYQIVCYKKDQQGIFFEYDRTEIVSGGAAKITFEKLITIPLIFEQKQPVRFELVCNETEKLIGQCQTQLGKIVGSQGSMILLNLIDLNGKNNGHIIIKAEKRKATQQNFIIEIQCRNLANLSFLNLWKTNSYMTFSRIHQDGRKEMIYKSETVKGTQNPRWAQFQLTKNEFCLNDPFQNIIGEIFDSDKQLFIGQWEFSLFQVNDLKQCQFQLMQGKKNVGQVNFLKFKMDTTPIFWDYMKGGLELQLIIAIDMTKSNKDPDQKDSLHSLHPNSRNFYLEAIGQVSEILLDYDNDKKVPLFGFGGKPQMPNLRSQEVLHCFPLTGDPYESEVDGLQGIVSAYKNAVNNVQFDGPTYFQYVIKQTMLIAQEEKLQGSNQYFILLILTDGAIHDMSPTKKLIVKSADLPLSIIIVGIGNEDFSDMNQLDGDDGLTDDDGNVAKRDLVQFVPYNQIPKDQLAQKVLEELPDQVVEYMQMIGYSTSNFKTITRINLTDRSKNQNNEEYSCDDDEQILQNQMQFLEPSLTKQKSNL